MGLLLLTIIIKLLTFYAQVLEPIHTFDLLRMNYLLNNVFYCAKWVYLPNFCIY